MNYYIKNIHINRLYHLHDLDIPIADEQTPHLIVTGKNGSGKTTIIECLKIIQELFSMKFLSNNLIL